MEADYKQINLDCHGPTPVPKTFAIFSTLPNLTGHLEGENILKK
jgi:hypothetical protein